MKKKVEKFLQILLGLLFGASMGLCVIPLVVAKYIDRSLLVFEAMIFLHLVPVLFVYSAVIMFHEAGHMVAGLLSGYSFVSYRVGSFTLIRLDGKLRLKRFSLAGTGGQCLLKPPAWKEEGIPVRFYNLGGILMNILLCLLSLPFCFFVPITTFGGMLLLSFCVLNGSTFLLNGVPLGINDGHNVLHLEKDKVAVRAFWAQMMGNALMAEGVPLVDIPEDLYDLPEDADPSNSLVASSLASASQIPLYHHRFEEADEAMKKVLEEASGLPPLLRFFLLNERIWFELMHENRKEVLADFADKEYQKFQKASRNSPSVIRTLYTKALSEENGKEAEEWKRKMNATAKSYPFGQEIEEERLLMKMAEEHFSAKPEA